MGLFDFLQKEKAGERELAEALAASREKHGITGEQKLSSFSPEHREQLGRIIESCPSCGSPSLPLPATEHRYRCIRVNCRAERVGVKHFL